MTLRKKITEVEFKELLVLAEKNPANRSMNPVIKKSPYTFLNGIPHKLVNGSYVQLTKIVK